MEHLTFFFNQLLLLLYPIYRHFKRTTELLSQRIKARLTSSLDLVNSLWPTKTMARPLTGLQLWDPNLLCDLLQPPPTPTHHLPACDTSLISVNQYFDQVYH